jgi:hypothetical protein
MENRPLSSQSSLLLKRRVASRPDIKAAKGASSCSVQPSTTTTGSSNNGKHKSSKALHGPKKYFYNVKSFQLIVPCRLGHRAPSTATSLLRLLEAPRPNIHHLLHLMNHHPEVGQGRTWQGGVG